MNNTIRRILSQVNFNRILIALFLIIYVGFYYAEYQKYITLSYGVLLLGFVYNWVKCRRIKYSSFLMMAGAFFLYSFLSVVWAPVFSSTQSVIGQLLKTSLVSCIFINLMNDEDDISFALFFLSLGALIYAILYLSNVEIAMLGGGRISAEDDSGNAVNVNSVALIMAFSFSYFLFMYFKKRNLLFLLGALVGFVVIFLLGSRKTILSMLLCVILIFVKLNKKSKVEIIGLLVVFFICASIFIPAEYLEFVFNRIFSLDTSSAQYAAVDTSGDEERVDLLIKGFDFFTQYPLFGHGYYGFSYLYECETGISRYSHNNFIETLVGGGIVAFILYYMIYYHIGKNLLTHKISINYGYLMIVLGCVLLFNHLTIVLLHDRFIWLLLALMWAGSCHYKRNVF